MTEVSQEFDKFYDSVKKEIHSDNIEFNKSLMKLVKRYKKYSDSQRVSAFQNFGSVFIGKTRRKIQVQQTAVSRRKSKIGSRQKRSNVKTKSLPSRYVSFKRKQYYGHY